MIKIVVCIVLLFAALVSSRGPPPPPRGGGGGGGRGHGDSHSGEDNGNGWETALCDNSSLAQSFLTQVQQLITTLQTNGSFGQVLTSVAQEVAYIQNSTDAALLSTNCTAYFAGLNSAIQADQQAAQIQLQYQLIAAQQFSQIVYTLVGNRGYHNHG